MREGLGARAPGASATRPALGHGRAAPAPDSPRAGFPSLTSVKGARLPMLLRALPPSLPPSPSLSLPPSQRRSPRFRELSQARHRPAASPGTGSLAGRPGPLLSQCVISSPSRSGQDHDSLPQHPSFHPYNSHSFPACLHPSVRHSVRPSFPPFSPPSLLPPSLPPFQSSTTTAPVQRRNSVGLARGPRPLQGTAGPRRL